MRTAKARTGVVHPPAASSTLERLKAEVIALESFDLDLLRKRWRSLTGRPAPAHLSRALLLRVLAYRLQTDELGAIDRGTERALGTIGESGVSGNETPIPSDPEKGSRAAVRPGTLLAREYGGVMHRVMAREEGFSWNGKTFRSLSEVAAAITGTKWNGPKFFGLRSTRPTSGGVGPKRQISVSNHSPPGAPSGRGDHPSPAKTPGGAS